MLLVFHGFDVKPDGVNGGVQKAIQECTSPEQEGFEAVGDFIVRLPTSIRRNMHGSISYFQLRLQSLLVWKNLGASSSG